MSTSTSLRGVTSAIRMLRLQSVCPLATSSSRHNTSIVQPSAQPQQRRLIHSVSFQATQQKSQTATATIQPSRRFHSQRESLRSDAVQSLDVAQQSRLRASVATSALLAMRSQVSVGTIAVPLAGTSLTSPRSFSQSHIQSSHPRRSFHASCASLMPPKSSSKPKPFGAAKEKKPMLPDVIYRVLVRMTSKNTFMNLVDEQGVSHIVVSLGGRPGPEKTSATMHTGAAEKFGRLARERGVQAMDIVFKGYSRNSIHILKGLTKYKFQITSIQDATPIPFNGTKHRKALK